MKVGVGNISAISSRAAKFLKFSYQLSTRQHLMLKKILITNKVHEIFYSPNFPFFFIPFTFQQNRLNKSKYYRSKTLNQAHMCLVIELVPLAPWSHGPNTTDTGPYILSFNLNLFIKILITCTLPSLLSHDIIYFNRN